MRGYDCRIAIVRVTLRRAVPDATARRAALPRCPRQDRHRRQQAREYLELSIVIYLSIYRDLSIVCSFAHSFEDDCLGTG